LLLAEKKFPRWRKGDSLGILINLAAADHQGGSSATKGSSSSSGPASFLYFYKNGAQIATRIEVLRDDPDTRMYPYCFLGQGEAVTFVYHGKKGLDAALKKSPSHAAAANPPP
jgi:hypothetical protein